MAIKVKINRSKYHNPHFGELPINREIGEVYCVDCKDNVGGVTHVTSFHMCGPYNVKGTYCEDYNVIETGELVKEICCGGCP